MDNRAYVFPVVLLALAVLAAIVMGISWQLAILLALILVYLLRSTNH